MFVELPKWTALCFMASCFVSALAPIKAEEPAKNPLLGRWQMLSVHDKGKPVELNPFTVDILADRLITTVEGSATECQYELHNKPEPKQIDLLIDFGDKLVLIGRGIYELRGDELHWYIARTDKERPKSFTQMGGDGYRYSVFRREKGLAK